MELPIHPYYSKTRILTKPKSNSLEQELTSNYLLKKSFQEKRTLVEIKKGLNENAYAPNIFYEKII